MLERGWSSCDFVLVTGDAYVDHPSFAAAVISRVLDAEGYKVGIIPQPSMADPEAFTVLGRPRLAFLVSAGNMDSLVNHYTANKKPRSEDGYSPGGKSGFRPDRATIAYCNKIREKHKGVPIIIGGIEASLRRLSHYDYWSDTVRKSILLDSKADILVYGMGESIIREIARALDSGKSIRELADIRGTVLRLGKKPLLQDGSYIELPPFEEVKKDPRAFAESFRIQYENTDPIRGKILLEWTEAGWLIQNPPAKPLTRKEMDFVYELPYTRLAHPTYETLGEIPALKEVRFSICSSRGCFGGCSFCALSFHQGRIVSSRSKESIIREAKLISDMPDFKGYIHDIGGPTANFRAPACTKQLKEGACAERQCLSPSPCANLEVDHSEYLDILRAVRALPRIKRVFIRSGIRFDYLMCDENGEFLEELCEYHVSGQLKVAPEHISQEVLDAMGKPTRKSYSAFSSRFKEINARLGKRQYLLPYFISAHPGSTLDSAIELAEYLRDSGFVPDQVQDFYPTPATISTCMYHTGIDPRTMKSVYVAKGARERAMQKALLHYKKPENRALVREALGLTGRSDLIGRGKKCLVE